MRKVKFPLELDLSDIVRRVSVYTSRLTILIHLPFLDR